MGELSLVQLTSPATIPAKARPRLVTGRELFDALAAAIKTSDASAIGKASSQLDEHQDYWKRRLGSEGDERLRIARGLVSCAVRALGGSTDFESPIDRARRMLSTEAVNAHTQWDWITTRELLVESGLLSRKVFHSVRVPIAFRRQDEQTAKKVGCLAVLEVTLLENGSGAVSHQPRDAFETRCGRDFVSAMTDAWNLARSEDTRFDGLWRVLRWDAAQRDSDEGCRPFSEGPINGRSAGGAAARAWALALRGMVEDPGVIWMLGLSRHANELNGPFESVEGIKEKVSEVASKPDWFDTIVVSPDDRRPVRDNYSDAVVALGRSFGRIQLVRL